ncbi:MAG: hypothetical protein IJU00_06160, partial [Selenomonas sp.]|nr:hypothetical protein [Selenomonas sp.]
AVLEAYRDRIIQGCISAQSVADMFYILRKDFTPEERRRILLDICQIMEVESIDKYKLIIALNNDSFNDFEDCLQAECAVTSNAERIVTRNIKHFSNSPVPAISPEDFCKQFLSVEIIDNQ